MSASIIDIALLRARRAIGRFRPRPDRAAVDTLYGPAQLGLSIADIFALEKFGFAEVRKIRTRHIEYRITLTPSGRRERDAEQRKAR
jgi:hypothetical protein